MGNELFPEAVQILDLHHLKENIWHTRNTDSRTTKKYIPWAEEFTDKIEKDDNTHTVEKRTVSLCQPHIRTIVRGKVRTPVEFGQKLAFSVVNRFTFIDRWSFDNFAEGNMLIESAERYKERHGFFPAVILGDTVQSDFVPYL